MKRWNTRAFATRLLLPLLCLCLLATTSEAKRIVPSSTAPDSLQNIQHTEAKAVLFLHDTKWHVIATAHSSFIIHHSSFSSSPLGLAPGLNLYLYALANPILYLDILGLCPGSRNFWGQYQDYMTSTPALESIGGFSVGMVESVINLPSALYQTVRHPIQTVQNIPAGLRAMGQTLTSGNSYETGRLVGNVTMGVEMSIAAGAAIKHFTTPKPPTAIATRNAPITNPSRLLPERAGPTAHISPNEVIGRTPSQIGTRAQQLGLQPRGPDPAMGRGAYIDPRTGVQRILSHPNATLPHGHVNNPAGFRIGLDGAVVPPNYPGSHLPINYP